MSSSLKNVKHMNQTLIKAWIHVFCFILERFTCLCQTSWWMCTRVLYTLGCLPPNSRLHAAWHNLYWASTGMLCVTRILNQHSLAENTTGECHFASVELRFLPSTYAKLSASWCLFRRGCYLLQTNQQWLMYMSHRCDFQSTQKLQLLGALKVFNPTEEICQLILLIDFYNLWSLQT